jgi:probable phosphoglycerate mutase
MNKDLPELYLARHGETAWSITGQHTSLTDMPLTKRGEQNAQRLGERLAGTAFSKVLTSPLRRAVRTCELAGFGEQTEPDPNLIEWNYGAYEGLRTAEIRASNPDWELFRDGCPNGESPEQIGIRACQTVNRMRTFEGNVLIFSSGHFLRVLAACWLGLGPGAGRFFVLNTASVSALGYENSLARPAIRFWNDTRHLEK